MKTMQYAQAIESALAQAMATDERIIILGEDVELQRRGLYVRFGAQRVRNTPISESAFLGAAVAAAMAGLRPVVEIIMVDFLGVAMDALLNHAAKIHRFSGGNWNAPLVIRVACGGGYGDGGQHQQSLWGWLAHIPGLQVVLPATPADAGGLLLSALACEHPVIYLEHKLLSAELLDYLGAGGRDTSSYDVPPAGACGPVPDVWEPVPIGKALVRQPGHDLSIISLGVGMHRALEAASLLAESGISAEVIDLRSVSPLDENAICTSVERTGRLLVVDEDYQAFGLSGEVAAVALEAGLAFRYRRVCTQDTLPYARAREAEALPNTARIVAAARQLLQD